MWEPFSSFLSDRDSNGNIFWSSEIAIVKEAFVLVSGNEFLVNYVPCDFIQTLFLVVDSILEIKCRPIFKEENYMTVC